MDSATPSTSRGQTLAPPDISILKISHHTSTITTRNCHLKWIEGYMPLSLSLDQKKTRVQGFIEDVFKHYEDFKDVLETSFARMNHRFLLAALNAYNSDFESALAWIEKGWECLETIKTSGTEPHRHVKAFTYLLMANYQMMMSQEGVKPRTLQHGDTLELSYSDTMDKMEMLYDDDGVFQALITAAQGILARIMKCQEDYIELVQEATRLDPKCAEWYRILHMGLRQRRRNLKPGTVPSAEEKIALTKAYEIDPNICFTQTLYASMLEEEMSFSRDNRSSLKNATLKARREQTANQVVELWTKSLEQNPNDKWTRVRLAEMYAYGKYPHLDRQEGVLMFQKIEKQWPEFTNVLHKFGKYFYMRGNIQKAFEYYKKALDLDMGNHPCLMDYLRTAARMGVTRQDMLTLVETCLSQAIFYKIPWLKIMTIRGILLWLIDKDGAKKTEACDVWIEAAMTYSSQTDRFTIIDLIRRKEWDVIGQYNISSHDVVRILLESLRKLQLTTTPADSHVSYEHEKRWRILNEFISDIESQRDVRRAGEGIPFGNRSANHNSNAPQLRRLSEGQSDSKSDFRAVGRVSLQSTSSSGDETGRYTPHPSDERCQQLGRTGCFPTLQASTSVQSQSSSSAADLDQKWRS